ncbi:MAG: DUF456 domain-containing protein [Gemmatimonadetes bacterium]|nr:DUF456 domain-containing protein [Gemmatimonadota bacterium]
MDPLVRILAIAIMAVGLFVIPLGLPGTWLMILVLGVAAFYGEVGLVVLFAATALALVAELAEYAVTKRMTTRYGGSRRAFWGALLGGMVGIFVGIPVPVVGSMLTGLLGSMAGAVLVTYLETRHLPSAGRVGWGVLLGRGLSIGVKVAAGVVILVLGAASLLVR